MAETYLVSEDERAVALREFRKSYFRMFWKILALLFAGAIGLVILSMALPPAMKDTAVTVGTWLLVLAILAYVLVQQRTSHDLPAAMKSELTPVQDRRTYRQASIDAAAQRSWPAHIMAGLFLILLGVLFFPGPGADPSAPYLYGLIATLAIAGWSWTAWLKIKAAKADEN